MGLIVAVIILLLSCSTKKDKFLNRNFQALNTKYNVLFNGQMAYEEAKLLLDQSHVDNFWTILPIEPLTIKKDNSIENQPKSTSLFDKAEKKAADAIQKRSMLITGIERNYQIDEVYMLLGKARYYDQRFIPSLDAFNYILYKHPTSSGLQEAAVWKEKVNVRLENEDFAIDKLKKIILELKDKKELYVEAQATIAQAFMNKEDYYCAIDHLKEAILYTKKINEKGRFNFILGQLYESVRYKDSAKMCYNKVIDFNRRIDRKYRIQSIINISKIDNFNNNDTSTFVKKWTKLLEDRENRPYLDYLTHHHALAYKNAKDNKKAIKYFNKSLKKTSKDDYLTASNYREIASIYYDEYQYTKAGKYYDSTLVKLTPKTLEYRKIKKRKDELEDVIKYESIANVNDSILSLIELSKEERVAYFKEYISKLKKVDASKEIENQTKSNVEVVQKYNINKDKITPSMMPPIDDEVFQEKKTSSQNNSNNDLKSKNNNNTFVSSNSGFYFYNLLAVSKGKLEFKKLWGNRKKIDNWRLSSENSFNFEDSNQDISNQENIKSDNPKYNVETYLEKIPTDTTAIDLLKLDRNFAYYQLGLIYKNKFKVNHLALEKLEKLLTFNPEKRLVLPTMYNLYELYLGKNDSKSNYWKSKILEEYPDSRYAQMLNKDKNQSTDIIDPEKIYKSIYETMEKGENRLALSMCETQLNNLIGEDIYPKLELLRATLYGKIKGLEAYKKELNYVALNYANQKEGKEAENILKKDIIAMENKSFVKEPKSSWNIIIPISKDIDEISKKELYEKLNKYLITRENQNIKLTTNEYDHQTNFVILYNFSNEQETKTDISVLKDYKDYLIKQEMIVVASINLEVIQIKKNLELYQKKIN
ncbi:MAG: tetratricopeptide repeat protein [Flavobacterium sp.]